MFTAGGSHARLSCPQGADLRTNVVCKLVPFYMPWKQASEKLTSGSKWGEVGWFYIFFTTTIYGNNPFQKYATIVLVEICHKRYQRVGCNSGCSRF